MKEKPRTLKSLMRALKVMTDANRYTSLEREIKRLVREEIAKLGVT